MFGNYRVRIYTVCWHSWLWLDWSTAERKTIWNHRHSGLYYDGDFTAFFKKLGERMFFGYSGAFLEWKAWLRQIQFATSFFAETVVCYLRGEDCAVSTVCLWCRRSAGACSYWTGDTAGCRDNDNGARWQTDWTSEYISKGKFDIYGLKTQIGELVALGAYEISEDVVTVHIVYMESQARHRGIWFVTRLPEIFLYLI